MELNEIAERLAKSENARKAFRCFTKLFFEHADGFSGDLKQFDIEFLRNIETAKRILSYCGFSENDLVVASLSISGFLKYTVERIEHIEAKRKRKREYARKRRAKRTPEQVEVDRAKAREHMRLVRAKQTPEQKAAAKAYHAEWRKRNRDRLRERQREYQRKYRAKHPKRKRGDGLRQGDLFQ